MKNKIRLTLLLVALILISLSCSLGGSSNSSKQDGLPDGVIENYIPQNPTPNIYNYSTAQQATVNTYGNPARFTIMFTADIRQETWYYDSHGYKVVFNNGDLLSEGTFNPDQGSDSYTTTYTPQMFFNGMGIDEIVHVTGEKTFVLSSASDQIEDSRLMQLEGLSIRLVQKQVNLVETVPPTNQVQPAEADLEQPPAEEPTVVSSESNSENNPPAPTETDTTDTDSYQAEIYSEMSEVNGFPFEATIIVDGNTATLNLPFFKEPLTMASVEPDTYVYEAGDQTYYLAYPYEDGFFLLSDSQYADLQYEISAHRAPLPGPNPDLSTAVQKLIGKHEMICDLDLGDDSDNGFNSYSYVQQYNDNLYLFEYSLGFWVEIPKAGPDMYIKPMQDGSELSIYITETRYTLAQVDEEMKASFVLTCYYPDNYRK